MDVSALDGFDYVALGHIHRAQSCSSPKIRYCGTPLKYSFSEVKHEKSVTVVEIGEKGSTPVIRTAPLVPLHDMSELRGRFSELLDPLYYTGKDFREHYLRIILTDEEDVPEAMGRLRQVYPRLLFLDYDNTRTRQSQAVTGAVDADNKSAFDLFADFFELQNNAPMTDEQSDYMRRLIERIEEEMA